MKRIYVAGAYSADNILDCLRNIGRGEDYAARVFLMGHAPFCPWHDKDYVLRNWDLWLSVDMFYRYSLAWLEVSDGMLVIPGWEGSRGTIDEIAFAHEMGIPVYWSLEDLPEVEE